MKRVLLVVIAAAGCERAGATTSIELGVPEVTVTMLDPGPEPRAPLVGKPTVGAHTVFDATAVIDYEFAGKTRPGSTTHERFTVRNLDVSPDGVVHGIETITEASVTPHPGALPIAHPTNTSDFVGRTLEFWRDAHGRAVQPNRVTFPADAAYEDGRALEMMMVSPDQALGIGARWHEHITMGARAADIDCVLVSRVADHVQIQVTFRGDRSLKSSDGSHAVVEAGTIVIDEDLGLLEAALHKNATLTMHSERGDLIGHETMDVVSVAP